MRRVHLAVVGGGPAGLSAAIVAARAGVQVTLFDEHPSLGGQLRYRILDGDEPLAERRSALIVAAGEAGVELHIDAKVWGVFSDRLLGVVQSGHATYLQADRIILATGSTDRALPVPGGTRPGVLTTRALQILLHCHRVLPGERYAILGVGPEAHEIARDINLAGGRIAVTIDPDALDAPLRVDGNPEVRGVTVGHHHYDVDIVVVAVGRQPDAALAMMAGCDDRYDSLVGGFVPLRDDRFQTSVEGILVVGDAAGVCDVSGAVAEGEAAGASVAHALGFTTDHTISSLLPESELSRVVSKG